MLTVRLLPPLSRLVGQKELTVDAAPATLGLLLERLVTAYPQLGPELGPDAGEQAYYYAVFVNGADTRGKQGNLTPLADGDEVVIMMPMGGGA
jgi:molybdopterin converting factor small subunit